MSVSPESLAAIPLPEEDQYRYAARRLDVVVKRNESLVHALGGELEGYMPMDRLTDSTEVFAALAELIDADAVEKSKDTDGPSPALALALGGLSASVIARRVHHGLIPFDDLLNGLVPFVEGGDLESSRAQLREQARKGLELLGSDARLMMNSWISREMPALDLSRFYAVGAGTVVKKARQEHEKAIRRAAQSSPDDLATMLLNLSNGKASWSIDELLSAD